MDTNFRNFFTLSIILRISRKLQQVPAHPYFLVLLSPQGNIKYSKKYHIYFSHTIYFSQKKREKYIGIFYYIIYFPEWTTILNSCPLIVTNTIYFLSVPLCTNNIMEKKFGKNYRAHYCKIISVVSPYITG